MINRPLAGSIVIGSPGGRGMLFEDAGEVKTETRRVIGRNSQIHDLHEPTGSQSRRPKSEILLYFPLKIRYLVFTASNVRRLKANITADTFRKR